MPTLHTRQDRQRSYRTVLQGFGQLHDVLLINFVHHQHHQHHMQTLLVTKLVAMATTLRHSTSARFSSDSLTPKTHPLNHTACRWLSYNQSYSPSKAKASYGNCVPKLVAVATSLSTCGVQSNTWFLGPIRAHNPNGISIGSAVFAQLTTECPYSLQWDSPIPPKIAPSYWGDLDTHLIHGSLGSTESTIFAIDLLL